MSIRGSVASLRARLLLMLLLPLLGMLAFATIWAIERRHEADRASRDNRRSATIVDAARLQYRVDMMAVTSDTISAFGAESELVKQFDGPIRLSIGLGVDGIKDEVARLRRSTPVTATDAAVVTRIANSAERMLSSAGISRDSSVATLLNGAPIIATARSEVAVAVGELIDNAQEGGTSAKAIVDLSSLQSALIHENISVLEAAATGSPSMRQRVRTKGEALQIARSMTLRQIPPDLRRRMLDWERGPSGMAWETMRARILTEKPVNLIALVGIIVQRAQVLSDMERDLAARLSATAAARARAASRDFRVALIVSSVLLLAALLVAWLVFRSIRGDLRRMTDHARRIAGGELDLPPCGHRGGHELALLGGTFDGMTGTLRALRDQLHVLADGGDRQEAAPLPGELGAAMERSMERVSEITDQLRVSEAMSRLTIDTAIEGILRVDERGLVAGANPAASTLIGVPVEEMTGRPISEILLIDGVSTSGPDVELVTDREGRLQRSDGARVDVLVSTRRVNTGDREHRIMLFIRDITDRKRMEDRLAWEALHDPLTGLPNRTALARGLTHEGERLQSGTVFFIDLDRFKAVNDTLGHEVGDELLRAVAIRIRTNVRANDVIIRMGGDEFVLVRSGNADATDAEHFAQRLIHALEEPIAIGDHTLRISASIGVVTADGSEDVAELIRRADQAMYVAKNAGRGQVSWYTPGVAPADPAS